MVKRIHWLIFALLQTIATPQTRGQTAVGVVEVSGSDLSTLASTTNMIAVRNTNKLLAQGGTPPASANIVYVDGKKYPTTGEGIQSAVNDAGLGGKIVLPCGSIEVTRTIVLMAGQHLEGCGWTIQTNSYTVLGGTSLTLKSNENIPLFLLNGTGPLTSVYSVSIENLALTNGGDAKTNWGIRATFAPWAKLRNIAIYGFNIGVEQGAGSWGWNVQSLNIQAANQYAYYAHDGGEDSTYIASVFRSYNHASGIGVYINDGDQNELFLGCDISENYIGVLLNQGETIGNGTGAPYAMHATFENNSFEDDGGGRSSGNTGAAIRIETANRSRTASHAWPDVIVIGGRGLVTSPQIPNTGQIFLDARQANSIVIENFFNAGGYSTGLNLGSVNSAVWIGDYGFPWGTSFATGNLAPLVLITKGQITASSLALRDGNTGANGERFGPTTATPATANAVAKTTYAWHTPFTDGNYTPICTPAGAVTGTPVWQGVVEYTPVAITIRVMTSTSVASSFGAVYCTAIRNSN